MSLFKVMVRALASHPDPSAVLVQHARNGHESAGEEREKCAGPADPEVAIRGSVGEGQSRAEHGTDKVDSGHHSRGIGGM